MFTRTRIYIWEYIFCKQQLMLIQFMCNLIEQFVKLVLWFCNSVTFIYAEQILCNRYQDGKIIQNSHNYHLSTVNNVQNCRTVSSILAISCNTISRKGVMASLKKTSYISYNKLNLMQKFWQSIVFSMIILCCTSHGTMIHENHVRLYNL